MSKFRFILSLLLFTGTLALISSCSLQDICAERFPCKDSTITITTVKDSLIYVPYQELTFDTVSPCDPKIIYKKEIRNGDYVAVLELKNGILSLTAKLDSSKNENNRLMRTIMTNRTVKTIPKIITEYKSHWYDIACRWLLLILFIVLLIDLLRAYLKSII